MRFRYDMRNEFASFDYYQWLVMAAAEGATEVVLDAREFKEAGRRPLDELRRRFESIILPGAHFLSIPSRESDEDGHIMSPSRLDDFVEFIKTRTFPRLHTVLPPGKAKYTVTLRRQPLDLYRNSNEDAWRQFADKIGATVIEDYDVRAITLFDRMALYAGAKMNFGVMGGPMWMCSLSPYPCMVFKVARQREFYTKIGCEPGKKLPWFLPNQHTVWGEDTLDNLLRHFEQWHDAQ